MRRVYQEKRADGGREEKGERRKGDGYMYVVGAKLHKNGYS
jgi:hypothetical protein